MPNSPNKLSKFWKELKRRNVIRVITVYAGAAFVIIELINNITEPLKLPEWTPTLIIVLLAIGLPVVIIFSWIYDVHPERGMVKTEPASKVKVEEIQKSSNGWRIASYISFIVIIGLIVLNILPRAGKKEIFDKSIAVLPFIDDSPDKDNEHIINGIMEDLLINLQSIKELRVPGRTSTEQYRNNPKPIPEIAADLNVAYIVEGSGQRYGNKIRLRVQLVEGANDRHVWADSYDEVINGTEDIFRIQSEIAQSIAHKLQAVITPEEKMLIEKTPTQSLTAYDLCMHGLEEFQKYQTSNNRGALNNAEVFFNTALEYDTAYARAYSGLANVYWSKHYWNDYFSENFLDTVLFLADIALSFDDELAEAYTIKGECYRRIGNREQANKEYDKAIELNPNDWKAYRGKGLLYLNDDFVIQIDNLHKAAFLNQGAELPSLLRDLCWAYSCIGFERKAKYYEQEALKLDGDSIRFYIALSEIELFKDNFPKALDFLEKAYKIDSTRLNIQTELAAVYSFTGQNKEALEYFQSRIASIKEGDLLTDGMHRIGYVYWENGMKEEADYYFDKQIEYGTSEIELGRLSVHRYFTYYNLAGVYAFRGEIDKAYENLRLFNQKKVMPIWMVWLISNDPMFESIRNEPEFQRIAMDIEAKYQAEHERVRQWLEENDML